MQAFLAFVARCGGLGGTAKVWPGVSTTLDGRGRPVPIVGVPPDGHFRVCSFFLFD